MRKTKHDHTPKPVGLKDLARYLGLSTATISTVLNGTRAASEIPKATQERILAAAEKFNYRPNAMARSLRGMRSHTVGVLVPEISEGYGALVRTRPSIQGAVAVPGREPADAGVRRKAHQGGPRDPEGARRDRKGRAGHR